MINNNRILIKNIYYMLSYAFRVLKQTHYEPIAAEEFEHVQDLLAAILVKGIEVQQKCGMYREYTPKIESLPTMRGKLHMSETLRRRQQQRGQLSCEYDQLSLDNLMNQILKATLLHLQTDLRVRPKYRQRLRRYASLFGEVKNILPQETDWKHLSYHRGNQSYEMLMNICYFVWHTLLPTTETGSYRMPVFSAEHMERLYETFVLEYYRQEHSDLDEVRAAQIKWNLQEAQESMIRFLPIMQTDIFLRRGQKILIIDTKYYAHIMQSRYDKETLRSNHLYQIFAYVKNQDAQETGLVSGMLLYAKTDEEICPDCKFQMGRNAVSIKTLDLNQEFKQITTQLDRLLEENL